MPVDEFKTIKKDLIENFEEVKEAFRKTERRSRAGLMLGLQEIGSTPNGFIGGYYPIQSNIIVLNKSPLRRIMETDPFLMKPYTTHVLLHEYIHSLGILDEELTRKKTTQVCRKYWGENHLTTQFSKNIYLFFPNLVYPNFGFTPEQAQPVELIKGFDKSNTAPYIA